MYGLKGDGNGKQKALEFGGMKDFLDELRENIVGARLVAQGYRGEDEEGDDLSAAEDLVVEEESEMLDDGRPHRHSLIGASAPVDPLGAMPTPLSPLKMRDENPLDEESSFR